MLSSLFGCCFPSKRSKSVQQPPDEQTRLLIPTQEEGIGVIPPVIPALVVVDQQKLKDRLEVIVRSTEGKMVNVNSHVPFNLNPSTLSASSSTFPYSPHTNSHYPYPNPLYSTNSSLSRSSSVSDSLSHTNALNVRLVRRGSEDTNGTGSSRRGRPRIRGTVNGNNGHVVAAFAPAEDAIQTEQTAAGAHARPVPVGLVGLGLGLEEPRPNDQDLEEQVQTPSATTFPNNNNHNGTNTTYNPSSPSPAASPRPFRIESPGNIALSWGD
ncbi:hypothetical protein DL96DRAFT_498808 [Flagelloscypha sp. PMI_526]|nr:hypothetical protein DL96DRAFT_498808 [Flagelloscypha sp. PMI_526]